MGCVLLILIYDELKDHQEFVKLIVPSSSQVAKSTVSSGASPEHCPSPP